MSENNTQLEAFLDQGLRNLWYPVASSWEVSNSPIGITRLGEGIVLWRDDNGVVRAVEDRCPHRGAKLSFGWNLGDRVACWYHGVEVDGDGVVTDVPAVVTCPMKGKKCVKRYPVEERNGAIFLWFGIDPEQEPDELILPEQLANDEWSSFLCMSDWKVNYRYAVDNVMDPMHGVYLHRQSHSMYGGDTTAEFKARNTETGFIFEKVGQMGVNFDWVEFINTGAHALRLSIPYNKKGPGGHFFIVGYATPVDAEHTRVFFFRCRKVDGWQRDTWRFLYRTKLEKLHWDVLEQDRVVLEQMAPNAREQEFLYDHDIGLARIRRLLQKEATKQLQQIAEVAERSTPTI